LARSRSFERGGGKEPKKKRRLRQGATITTIFNGALKLEEGRRGGKRGRSIQFRGGERKGGGVFTAPNGRLHS